jgi:hypothetical protein
MDSAVWQVGSAAFGFCLGFFGTVFRLTDHY